MSATIQTLASKYLVQEGATITIPLFLTYTENITGIQISANAGVDWTNLTTNLEMPLIYDGVGTDSEIVFVTINPAIQAELFDGVTSNDQVYFRALMDGSEQPTLSAAEFFQVSSVNIVPNNNNTDATDLNQLSFELHAKPFHSSEVINIIWDAGTTEFDETPVRIYLRWGGDVGYTEVPLLPPMQSVLFGKGHYTSTINGYTTGANGRVARVVIKSASDDVPQLFLIGKAFAVTHNVTGQYQAYVEGALGDIYPTRVELFSRAAAEKAMYPDEVPTLSQIEAGRGVLIRQRDYLGKKVNKNGVAGKLDFETESEYNADSPEDRSKAFNLVIEVDPTTIPIPEVPRVLQGYIDFNTLGDVVEETVDQYDYQYGSLRRYRIYHNWGLGEQKGVVGDARRYQTHNSYHLEFMHVKDELDEAPNYGWSKYDAVPVFATVSRDAIDVWCNVKKDTVYRGAKSADQVFNGSEDLPHYIFEYRLLELIPGQ